MADIPNINGFVLFHPPNVLEELVDVLPMLSLLEVLESILLELDEEEVEAEDLDKLDLLDDEELTEEELDRLDLLDNDELDSEEPEESLE
jgi:hypothetical protein